MACQLICPNLRCRKIVRAGEEQRGRIVRCPNCRCMMRVPPKRSTPAVEPAVNPLTPAEAPPAPPAAVPVPAAQACACGALRCA